MLREEHDFNRRLKESIVRISKNRFDDATLARLVSDNRSLVYVLADSSWSVLCVLQVYLEGKFPRKNSHKAMSLSGTPLRHCFNNFKILRRGLTGAKIFRSYAQTEVDAFIAFDILTRFYNGEEIVNMRQVYKGSLVRMHECWLPKIHYLGVRLVTNDVNNFLNWEKCGFKPLYVGEFKSKFEGAIESVECSCYLMKIFKFYNLTRKRHKLSSLSDIAESSQSMFCQMLGSQGKDLCPFFALSIIKSFAELKQRNGQCELQWNIGDVDRVSDFLYGSKSFSAIAGLLPGLAMAYFTGKLPVVMTGYEELTLLMMGLQLKLPDETTSVLSFGSTQYIEMYRELFENSLRVFGT